jgi:hypothetical protein
MRKKLIFTLNVIQREQKMKSTTSLGILLKAASLAFVIFFSCSVGSSQIGGGNDGQIELDKSGIAPIYTNFVRVTGSPDEAVLDFGMFVGGEGEPLPPIKVHHQAVMNYYTLKRLSASLQATLERHEQAFGPIELDVNKRLKQ